MQLLKQAVGIDIAKDSLAVCFGTIDQQQRIDYRSEASFANSTAGFARLLDWVEQHRIEGVDLCFVMEATGVYYQNLAYVLNEAGLKLAVMLPNYVKQFARSTSVTTKTDRVDARLLCRLALERRIEQWQPSSAVMQQLKDLMRERSTLVAQRTAVRNRLAALDASYRPSQQQRQRLEQQLVLYKEQLVQIDREIEELIEQDPDLKKRIEGVMQISGVGLVTILTLIAETDGFALVRSQKQLVSYAGLDIVESQSGQHRGRAHISKRGNRRLRTALYMPALAAIRCDEAIRAFYQRLCRRYGKVKKPAIIAVARKLLRTIYAIWKSDQPYRPQPVDLAADAS